MFSLVHGSVTLIWPPAGISLVTLLLYGRRLWPGVLLGALLANASTGVPALSYIGMSLGATSEAVMGVWLLRSVPGFDLTLSNIRDILALILFGAVLSSLVSALCGAGGLVLGGVISWGMFVHTATLWWQGDALSSLVLAPALLALAIPGSHNGVARHPAEAMALILSLLAACLLVFFGWFADSLGITLKAFILFPLLSWAAISFRQRGAALATLFVAIMAAVGGSSGVGYFGSDFQASSFGHYWLYVASLAMTSMLVAGVYFGRVRSETALHQQLDLYDALIQAQSDVGEGVAVIENDRIVYANDAMQKMFGYTALELYDLHSSLMLVHPEDRELVRVLRKRRQAHEPVPKRYEVRALRRDGSAIYVELAGATQAAEVGTLRQTVVLIDITERKHAEQALHVSQQDFRELVGSVQAIVWRATPSGQFTFVSSAAETLLGYPLAEWTSSPTFWVDHMHPDDREWAFQYCKTESEKLQTHKFDCRMMAADGRAVWLHDIVRVIPFNGKPKELVGVMLDITERKTAETRKRLTQVAFDNAAEGILITDADERIIDVNLGFTSITGYSREEVIGQTARTLSSGMHDRTFFRGMWLDLATQGQWQGEIWNRRKNGEIFPEWLSINTVRDDHGKLTHYVAVFSDITLRKQSEERMHHLANHDALTQLPNRNLLHERIEHALRLAQRSKSRAAILFLDLDRFKIINDTLGHEVGDQMLIEVASRLQSCLRDVDTIARQGGDEFVILIENFTDAQYLVSVARKILAVLSAPFVLGGHELFISASIGISVYPDDGREMGVLLKNADVAMYRSKDQGRNTYQFYSARSNVHSLEKLALESSLRRALDRNEFELHYQPKVNPFTDQITGVEALLRWNHPDLGMVSPAQFISLAEETGLIIPMGEWVLREACRQTRKWHEAGLPLFSVAVNLSARQFRDEHLRSMVHAALATSGLTPEYLELEITESMIMQNVEHAIEVLHDVRDMGANVSIDDFGTGYSSLGYLKRFPIDTLKVDRSFVQDVADDADDAAITKAVIALAHSLNLKVVAEGVETHEQFTFLRQQGCDMIQGYIYSKPLPAEQLEHVLVKGTISPTADHGA